MARTVATATRTYSNCAGSCQSQIEMIDEPTTERAPAEAGALCPVGDRLAGLRAVAYPLEQRRHVRPHPVDRAASLWILVGLDRELATDLQAVSAGPRQHP